MLTEQSVQTACHAHILLKANTTYVYDANNRLLHETKTEGITETILEYHYDRTGNQISKISSKRLAATGEPAAVRVFVVGEAQPTGFVAEIYAYNALNQLVDFRGQTTKSYTYKSDGLRAEFVWDGANVVSDGAKRYYRGVNLISDGTTYYLYNAHGDVVQLYSDHIVGEYQYDAFGNEVNPDSADGNPFRYYGESSIWRPGRFTSG